MPHTTIEPGDCFYSPMHGMKHYFQQQEESVVHVNVDSVLINRLDKNHIRNSQDELRIFTPVSPEEFIAVARQCIADLGFLSVSRDVLLTPGSN